MGLGGLKICIWFLIGYVYLKKVDIVDLNHSDFQYLSDIFKNYSVDFLCYQSKFLLKTLEKVAWTDDQVLLLKSIIKQTFRQKNWNTVANELFMNSNKAVFKTPKQCRERWLNHEDPVKIRSDWMPQQDIQLLKLVKSSGKKWSQISCSI